MTIGDILELLSQVRDGQLPIDKAVQRLGELPYRDLGIATVDHHRSLRLGVPEVIYGEGKTADQISTIVTEMVRVKDNVLITRLCADKAAVLKEAHQHFEYRVTARVGRITLSPVAIRPAEPVAIVCAGTSDVSVAEEAAETLSAIGLRFTRIYDVGVAGLHRLLGRSDELTQASAAIVIAGMEGALPSVIGGIIAAPVIAVPTSVGYGAALGGLTALMSMLTSCASGVTVVNIDNGFGAAMAVHRMLAKAG